MLLKPLTVSTVLFTSLAYSRVHQNHDTKKEAIEKNRDDFDEKLLWGGEDMDEDEDEGDYPNDDVFGDDEWHPDELDEEVRNNRFSRLVHKMDENTDGFVDKKELVHWTLRALQNMDARELKEDWEIADNDNDGGVGWEEYVSNIYGVDKEKHDTFMEQNIEDSHELQDFNRQYNREKAKFEAADKNSDGKLDEAEYANFYNPGHSAEQTNNAISLAMKVVDSDKDGQLSITEFLNDFKNPSYKGDDDWMETEKDIFKDMDMNGDGYLNGDELILWIQQDNGEIAVDEAIHLIETADKDEDGKLSHDEVMEAMEDFIESDATEYGFMLKHDEL